MGIDYFGNDFNPHILFQIIKLTSIIIDFFLLSFAFCWIFCGWAGHIDAFDKVWHNALIFKPHFGIFIFLPLLFYSSSLCRIVNVFDHLSIKSVNSVPTQCSVLQLSIFLYFYLSFKFLYSYINHCFSF